MKVHGQLEKAIIENLTSDPTGAGLVAGRMWYRTDTNTFKVYDGSGTKEFADLASAQTFQNKTLTSPQVLTELLLAAEALLKFGDSGSNYTAFKAPASLTGSNTYTLPDGDGGAGEVLSTNGSGTLSWVNPGALSAPTGMRVGYVGLTAPTGWVLASGRTIGSAGSGATERANADTEALYTLLWNDFSNTELPIQDSSGTPTTRGASAAADFAADKRLPVPDYRGRSAIGKDDMGGTPASRITSAGSGIDGTVLGDSGGTETHTLAESEIPSHTHTQASHYHLESHSYNPGAGTRYGFDDTGINTNFANHGAAFASTSSDRTSSIAPTINNTGGGGAHQNTQPGIVETVIIKL